MRSITKKSRKRESGKRKTLRRCSNRGDGEQSLGPVATERTNDSAFRTTPRAATAVAQVGNLLHRRLAVGPVTGIQAPADCQSAIQQTARLRYNKLARVKPNHRPIFAFRLPAFRLSFSFPQIPSCQLQENIV